MPSLDPAVALAISFGLVLLFGLASLHKIFGWARFRETVDNYRLLPSALVPAAAVAIAGLELTTVGLLCLPATRRSGATLAAALLVLYAFAMAANLARGRTTVDCGCLGFGRRQHLQWWMVIRNLTLAVLAALLVLPATTRALTALDAVTVLGATLTLTFLYAAYGLLAAAAPRTGVE